MWLCQDFSVVEMGRRASRRERAREGGGMGGSTNSLILSSLSFPSHIPHFPTSLTSCFPFGESSLPPSPLLWGLRHCSSLPSLLGGLHALPPNPPFLLAFQVPPLPILRWTPQNTVYPAGLSELCLIGGVQ